MKIRWFKHSKVCPVCRWAGSSFMKICYPNKPADCLVCPICNAYERHRFAYLVLKDSLSQYAQRTLHIAPEKCLEVWLHSISVEYIAIDLSMKGVTECMDITALNYPSDRFSLVWCSHVLEHIEDDRKAMSEIYRVLSPLGMAVIQVPIYGDKTYENHNIKSPEDRIKHFKQADHVRLYGMDIKDNLADAGFMVDVIQLSDIPHSLVERHALEYPSTKEIFMCRKRETRCV